MTRTLMESLISEVSAGLALRAGMGAVANTAKSGLTAANRFLTSGKKAAGAAVDKMQRSAQQGKKFFSYARAKNAAEYAAPTPKLGGEPTMSD